MPFALLRYYHHNITIICHSCYLLEFCIDPLQRTDVVNTHKRVIHNEQDIYLVEIPVFYGCNQYPDLAGSNRNANGYAELFLFTASIIWNIRDDLRFSFFLSKSGFGALLFI